VVASFDLDYVKAYLGADGQTLQLMPECLRAWGIRQIRITNKVVKGTRLEKAREKGFSLAPGVEPKIGCSRKSRHDYWYPNLDAHSAEYITNMLKRVHCTGAVFRSSTRVRLEAFGEACDYQTVKVDAVTLPHHLDQLELKPPRECRNDVRFSPLSHHVVVDIGRSIICRVETRAKHIDFIVTIDTKLLHHFKRLELRIRERVDPNSHQWMTSSIKNKVNTWDWRLQNLNTSGLRIRIKKATDVKDAVTEERVPWSELESGNFPPVGTVVDASVVISGVWEHLGNYGLLIDCERMVIQRSGQGCGNFHSRMGVLYSANLD